MADFNFSSAPYHNRFNALNDWTLALFQPDRPLQQSELNEMQSILHYYLKSVGDAVFSDGNMQTGMEFVLDNSGNLTVGDGQVYVEGKVRNFKKQTIKLNKIGREFVGVKVEQSIITADQDSSLLDQTAGVPSAFSKGADRLKETVVLTLDDPQSATIYQFDNGKLFVSSDNPEMTKINEILAERTYDESGSYRVNGFNMWTEPHPTDTSKIQLVIDTGRAYVLGYKVDKPTSTRIPLDKARDTRSVANEGQYYDTAVNRIKLGNSPVETVTRVTGQVQVPKEQVSRGSQSGGTDFLSRTSVFQIDRVWTENPTSGEVIKEYTQGTDFQLINGQAVSWAPNGAEPTAGATYYVSYRYNKSMVLNTDYKITIEGTGDTKTWYIDFSDMTGSKPIQQSLVNVDYNYYLARKDLIVLDRYGEVTVHKGQPDNLRLAEAPAQVDPSTLQIGVVTIYPESETASAMSFSVTRLSMADLQKMRTRIDNIEYNEAVNALDNPAMAGENPVTLRSVFSDGFISLDKYDSTHPDAIIAFSFEDAEITLPYQEVNKVVPKMLENASEAYVWGRLVSAPFTEEKTISQPFASEAMNVNPYNVFNKQGVITLTPSADNWIEEERVTVTQDEVKSYTVNRWWLHGGNYYSDEARYLHNNLALDAGQSWSGTPSQNKQVTGTTLTAGGQQTLESMIEFMRQIDIVVEGKNYLPNANNLYALFDGVRVPITPASGYRKGTDTGTLMANADGTVKGTITIPAGIRCGVREVTLRNADNLGISTFTAQGRKKTVQDIIIRTHVTANLYDPLAQSFQFTDDRVITSLGLHFASKDAGENNVIVQIRGMSDGGQPNKTIYAERVLTPAQVNVSADSSKETKVTFDDPIMCKAGQEYCIVIVTDSDSYTMWLGTRGKPRIDSPSDLITSNPYVQGVLFSSSNASTWTAHQDSDLKFNVYTAKFNEQAVLEFDTMKNVKVDRVVLMSTYLTPNNTGCIWDMKIVLDNEPTGVTVADKEWQPIGNYQDLDVEQLAREVKLRATFVANNYISPLLSLDDIMFAGFLTALKGSYVSRNINMTDSPYNTVKISYEAFLPANTTVKAQFSTDAGITWKDLMSTPVVTQQTADFYKYEYEEKVIQSGTYKGFKVRLNLASQNSFLRPRARRLMCLMKDE
ncbi:virulence-associated protein [Listeria phage LP-066]|uniref:Virulence-associated protein n=1 Tax=Listeria phage LP-066 TaxID=2590051 RepID=A0A514U7U1_9CAUD|nr:virulence-associated protein [Listeria phage LP-066]